MARYKCPACGSPYDGKRCRECCYEPFTEEVAHRNHYHEGEPLVIKKAPARKPVRPTEKRSCDTFPGKRKKKLPVWLRVILILLFLTYGVDILFGIAGSLMVNNSKSDIFSGYAEVEPEPILPEDGTVLFDEGDILVVADWRDGDPYADTIPVYVRNDSSRDIRVSAQLVSVNGYMTENSFLYCSAEAGRSAMDTLWLDLEDLEDAGIKEASRISFCLNIYDADSYETIVTSDMITLRTDAVETPAPAEDGTVLYEENGIQFVYTGCIGETCADGELRFYLENNTGRFMNLYIDDVLVNGESADLFMWQELPPDCKAITYIDLYSLEDSGIETVAAIHTVEFVLGISDRDDWDFLFQSEPLRISLEGA